MEWATYATNLLIGFSQFSEQMGRTLSTSDFSEINNTSEFEWHSENNTICGAPVLTVLFHGCFCKQTFSPACKALNHRAPRHMKGPVPKN